MTATRFCKVTMHIRWEATFYTVHHAPNPWGKAQKAQKICDPHYF